MKPTTKEHLKCAIISVVFTLLASHLYTTFYLMPKLNSLNLGLRELKGYYAGRN